MNRPNKDYGFHYSLRKSTRARRVRLAVKPYQGLEVVIPRRFPEAEIPAILRNNREWISRQLIKHEASFHQAAMPGSITLTFNKKSYRITCSEKLPTQWIETPLHLALSCDSEQQAIGLLRNWIRSTAQRLFPQKIESIAKQFGFSYRKIIIRSQKTRWGSCSSSGTISLNDQLLFMPAEAVDYLMIHELCHTRHMNHSSQFWLLVRELCPDFQQHEQTLRRGWERVPDWFKQSLHGKSFLDNS